MMLLAIIFITYALLLVDVVGLAIIERGKRQQDDASQTIWLTKDEPMDEDLLRIQAVIVKDEGVNDTRECDSGPDVRFSNKRYLMCSGSILASNFILTSASCIHEVIYVRHNIRATLAVLIAPFSDAAQIIKVSEYHIHPDHVVDPRNVSYPRHNIAILKLACSISDENLKVVELPDRPLAKECLGDSCLIAVIKRTALFSFTMYQNSAKFVQDSKRKRRRANVRSEIENINRDGKNLASQVTRKRMSNASKVINSNDAGNATISHKTAGNSITRKKNRRLSNKAKSISIRESTGIRGCAQTGTPVMNNNIQTAMVVSACDDRQPNAPWRYSDLFDNIDWLNEMLDKIEISTTTLSSRPNGAPCSTCIYNIFIEYNCNNGTSCLKSQSDTDDIKIPGLDLSKCSKNRTVKETTEPPEVHNEHREISQDAYLTAIDKMYRNISDDDIGDNNSNIDIITFNKNGDDDSELNPPGDFSMYMSRRINPNLSSSIDVYDDQIAMTTKRPESWEAPSDYGDDNNFRNFDTISTINKEDGVTGVNENFNNDDGTVENIENSNSDNTTYRKAKEISSIDDMTEKYGDSNKTAEALDSNVRYVAPPNNKIDNEDKSNKISIGEYFHDNKYEKAGIPKEYVDLYNKFKEYKKSKMN